MGTRCEDGVLMIGVTVPSGHCSITCSPSSCPQTLAHMKVVQFQGNHKANSPPVPPMTLKPIVDPDLTPSPDVPLAILKRKLMYSNDITEARRLLKEINAHLQVRSDRND